MNNSMWKDTQKAGVPVEVFNKSTSLFVNESWPQSFYYDEHFALLDISVVWMYSIEYLWLQKYFF